MHINKMEGKDIWIVTVRIGVLLRCPQPVLRSHLGIERIVGRERLAVIRGTEINIAELCYLN